MSLLLARLLKCLTNPVWAWLDIVGVVQNEERAIRTLGGVDAVQKVTTTYIHTFKHMYIPHVHTGM